VGNSMDVVKWLRGLGLEQYAPAFRDDDVDAEVLPDLTADDLIALGVSSIGRRHKLPAAITALGAQVPAARATAPAPADAERRQLTVMFCDLIGSTRLSTRLDPEDLRDVISAYHRAVAEVLAGFDGFVAKYMGDGVLVYFGYPRAHEDDAENRHKGQLILQQGHRAAAEDLYRKAPSIAQEQEAKLWELRAAASLARLWRDQGRRAEARDLLAPVYGWFTEGFATPDLKDPKALLEGLT
jgi:class 3 adenylate cyclase